MKIKKKHNKTQEEAKERMIALADTMGMDLQWVDNQSAVGSMQFNSVTITGAARVTDSHIELDVELPRLARMFSSRIEREVERKMGDALK